MTLPTHVSRSFHSAYQRTIWRACWSALVCAVLMLAGTGGVGAQGGTTVGLLDVDGTITPVMATYI
ncbi:MAG: hypothetical protein ACRD1H_10695, partial [Vicinamibacterales bacterium]